MALPLPIYKEYTQTELEIWAGEKLLLKMPQRTGDGAEYIGAVSGAEYKFVPYYYGTFYRNGKKIEMPPAVKVKGKSNVLGIILIIWGLYLYM